jgi:hypothetical protein
MDDHGSHTEGIFIARGERVRKKGKATLTDFPGCFET